jgi:hypothetical protein
MKWLILLVLAATMYAQNLVGEMHVGIAQHQFDPFTGVDLGWTQPVCIGGFFLQDSPQGRVWTDSNGLIVAWEDNQWGIVQFPAYQMPQFQVDVYDPVFQKKWYGRYEASWVSGVNFVDNVLSTGAHVVGIQGELLGTWTPYKLDVKTGKWFLQKKYTRYGVSGWFSDSQLASDAELTHDHILGCGEVQIIFGVLQ